MAGKRVSLASLATATVEAVPGASRPDLIHIPPDTVAPTPLNPRRAFDDTELAELGQDMRGGQLQPCVAVAKAAYLKLYPEHAHQLPEGCRYVMAAGERRWRAAITVGLPTLDVMVRHDLTESRIRFLAAVLSENVQRANFNPIEEANGLGAMLELHNGNQSAAAQAMGKSKGWFNQRIGLLRLTDDMVQLVLEGKLTAFRDMRRYAALPADEQYPAWKTDQDKLPTVPREAKVLEAVPDRQTYTAVHAGAAPVPGTKPVAPPTGPNGQSGSATLQKANTTADPAPPDAEPKKQQQAAVTVHPRPAGDAVPVPRTDGRSPSGTTEVRPQPQPVPPEPDRAPRLFPYDDPKTSVLLCHQKMSPEGFVAHVAEALRVLRREHPDAFQDVLEELPSAVGHHP